LQELVDEQVQELSEAHIQSRKRLAEIAHMNRLITSSVFSAAIAHELRQPLAAILSNAEAAQLFLERDPPAIGQVQDILSDICRDDQRANNIIQRMRDLLNKKDTEIKDVDINEMVQDVLQFLGAEAKMRGVAIVPEYTPALRVSGDRVQLQQVLINLILNSMDAMGTTPPEQRRIFIKTTKLDAATLEVVVTDGGIGFDENIEHAFESFFTTKPQGMGLGLSITASLIHAHGGRIWAENRPEGGAIVHFTLPLQQEFVK
jgi:signal transduction histidine kinase